MPQIRIDHLTYFYCTAKYSTVIEVMLDVTEGEKEKNPSLDLLDID